MRENGTRPGFLRRRARWWARYATPTWALWAVAVAACLLYFGRDRWGAAPWFPIVIGVVAAVGIIVMISMFDAFIEGGSPRKRRQVVFFAFCAVASFAGFGVVVRESAWAGLLAILMGGFFLWGALGVANRWPGFRPPPQEWECPQCGYDLTGNESGVCPECGTGFERVEG